MAEIKKTEEILDGIGFTPEELDAIRAEARKAIDDQIKAQKKAELLKQYTREEKAKSDPNEELVTFTVDVPGFARALVIDGVEYQQGQIRTVTRKQYDSMRDIMANAWQHEHSIGGEGNRAFYQRPKNESVGPGTVVNTRKFARV